MSAVVELTPPPDAPGFDLRPDPLQAGTAAELVRALRQYRLWAGEPSLRVISRRSGVAASTICSALRAEEMPRLELVLAIVSGCGASDEDKCRFATAWRAIRLAAQSGLKRGVTAARD